MCDDCSTDKTEARIRDWERRDERVRYLPTSRNSGAPAAARNLGVGHARGDWIAFLDDDDEWLLGELATQRAALVAEAADVISTNALRNDGSLYFPGAAPLWRPTHLDLLNANPIVVSSVIVRRELLLSADGFPTYGWTTGIDNYAVWLELANRGARFLVLGEALVATRMCRGPAQPLPCSQSIGRYALGLETCAAEVASAQRASRRH